jgi:hypothetical protein
MASLLEAVRYLYIKSTKPRYKLSISVDMGLRIFDPQSTLCLEHTDQILWIVPMTYGVQQPQDTRCSCIQRFRCSRAFSLCYVL